MTTDAKKQFESKKAEVIRMLRDRSDSSVKQLTNRSMGMIYGGLTVFDNIEADVTSLLALRDAIPATTNVAEAQLLAVLAAQGITSVEDLEDAENVFKLLKRVIAPNDCLLHGSPVKTFADFDSACEQATALGELLSEFNCDTPESLRDVFDDVKMQLLP
jgi:hypothetical protein